MTEAANPAETAIPTELLADLKRRHGTVHVLVAAGAAVVVRHPSTDDWHRFYKRAASSKRHLAAEELVTACVVYPTTMLFALMLKRQPALAVTFVDPLLKLAGCDPGVASFTP